MAPYREPIPGASVVLTLRVRLKCTLTLRVRPPHAERAGYTGRFACFAIWLGPGAQLHTRAQCVSAGAGTQ